MSGRVHVEESAIEQPRAITRMLFAAVAGWMLAMSLLYGVALLMERQGHSPVLEQVKKRQAKKAGKGKRAQRMQTVVHHRKSTDKRTALVVAPPKKKPKKKELKPVDKLDGQVVETARPEREERPQVAKYLGRYDMTVLKEKRSRGRKRKTRDLGKVDVKKASRLQSPDSKSLEETAVAAHAVRQKQQLAKGDKSEAETAKKPGQGALADGGVARDGPGAQKGGGDPDVAAVKPSVVRGTHAQLLLPATSPGNILHNIQALSGSPGSDDYLPDVLDEGDTNLLNTRKFRYWDFFQRIKERVRAEWAPGRVWRQRDPTGKRYGVRDRLTVVRVTLDPDGALKQVRVAQRSGLAFLDEEARRAFTAAGPYPNPPHGLKNEAGEVEFKFGFMFEISSARFRFYRMRN